MYSDLLAKVYSDCPLEDNYDYDYDFSVLGTVKNKIKNKIKKIKNTFQVVIVEE